jgi:proteic killer suppression protein
LIESFGDKRTERLFRDQPVREFIAIAARAKRKLIMLHAASRIDDLLVPPSNRLERLHGRLKHMHSIRVNDQWRIVFVWTGNHAREVAIVDYH